MKLIQRLILLIWRAKLYWILMPLYVLQMSSLFEFSCKIGCMFLRIFWVRYGFILYKGTLLRLCLKLEEPCLKYLKMNLNFELEQQIWIENSTSNLNTISSLIVKGNLLNPVFHSKLQLLKSENAFKFDYKYSEILICSMQIFLSSNCRFHCISLMLAQQCFHANSLNDYG